MSSNKRLYRPPSSERRPENLTERSEKEKIEELRKAIISLLSSVTRKTDSRENKGSGSPYEPFLFLGGNITNWREKLSDMTQKIYIEPENDGGLIIDIIELVDFIKGVGQGLESSLPNELLNIMVEGAYDDEIARRRELSRNKLEKDIEEKAREYFPQVQRIIVRMSQYD